MSFLPTGFRIALLILLSNPLLSQQLTVSDYDHRISQLDDQAVKSTKMLVKVPDWSVKGKVLSLVLYYKDSTPIKLEYPNYDVDGTPAGKVHIYFDEHGRLYAGIIYLGENRIVSVFPGVHTAVQYSKGADGKPFKSDQDRKTQLLREENYAYLTDLYMQYFPSIKYSYNPPAADAPPVLRVRKSNVTLLDTPGGKIIASLKKGDYLNYLGRSAQQANVNGKKYIYYKVLTSNKKTGWVWGDPVAVNDEGDE